MIRRAVAMVTFRADAATGAEQLEREGQPVTLVCLDPRRHQHDASLADVIHVPRFSAGVIAAFVTTAIRKPAHVLRSMRFPPAVYLARLLQRRGVTEIRGTDRKSERVASLVRPLLDAAPPDLSDLPIDWSRIGAEPVALRWFSKHINSITAEVSSGDRRYVIKRQRSHHGGAAEDRWARERRILLSLGESMGHGALSVPRVLFDDREHAIVVMERARGTPLSELFIAAASNRSVMPQLENGVRGAGAWLAAMQNATRRAEDGHALLDELTSIAVSDAAKLASFVKNQPQIEAFLAAGRRSLRSRPLSVVGHHDDYWPGNIFVEREQVTVIDFESSRDGLELEDAAFFLIRCEMMRRRFRIRFPQLAQRFFEGYGRQPDAQELRFFTVTKGLRLLARGVGEELPMPQRIWTRRMVRNIVIDAVSS
jgi:hypothetical protein